MKSITAVIVGYQSREALGPCLASLLPARKELGLEAILVDNASDDGTVHWVRKKHPWVEVVANETNVGFTRAVNQGLARAKGDLLLILNPDCEVTVDAIERLAAGLEAHTDAGAVAPLLVDAKGRVARSCGRFPSLWTLVCDHLGLAKAFPDTPWFGGYKYGGTEPERLGRVAWASGAALLVTRSAYAWTAGLDEQIFMYMEEVDWCRRAAGFGFNVYLVPDARIVHHGQQSSRQTPTETYLHNLRSRVYYFRKHHGPIAAHAAKSILALSLALKWVATTTRARKVAEVYARGLAVLWSA